MYSNSTKHVVEGVTSLLA